MFANTNPFAAFDVTKVMVDLDPAKFADSFSKMANGYAMPEFNMDAMIDAQRKNIEALNAVNKAAVEGVQALAQRQNEIMQDLIKETTDAVNQMIKVEGPEDAAVKQVELLKAAYEKAVATTTELAGMMASTNSEATKLINARVAANLDEVKKQAVALKKKK